jgi:hypothetical protein
MKPRRVQLKRTKGWRLPENTVVVSRPSRWGNPFRVGHVTEGVLTRDSAQAVQRFREHVQTRPEYLEAIRRELRGRNLACWCALGSPCHADVLLELAND